jgi:hypothetical protein
MSGNANPLTQYHIKEDWILNKTSENLKYHTIFLLYDM